MSKQEEPSINIKQIYKDIFKSYESRLQKARKRSGKLDNLEDGYLTRKRNDSLSKDIDQFQRNIKSRTHACIDNVEKAIDTIIIENILSFERAFPYRFIEELSTWDEVFNSYDKRYEAILECKKEKFNKLEVNSLKELIKKNNKKIKKHVNTQLIDLSDEDLIHCKKNI